MPLLQGYLLPALVTLLLHAAMLWVLQANWDQTEARQTVRPQVIQASLVRLEQSQPEPPPRQAPAPAPKPQPAPSQATPKPQPQVDVERQRRERERVERERAERERAERQRIERERAEREARQRAEQQAREEQLAALASQEEERFAARSREELAMSHIGAIQQAIAGRWSRPPSARRNMEVVLLINLIPTGDVVSVRVIEGSGNAAFDRSAINAVNKVERFPELAQLPPRVFEEYFRELRLVFRPEDLRL
jgi:colicin import membrane protein